MNKDKVNGYEQLYDAEYYKTGLGEDYNNKEIWMQESDKKANKIIEIFNPKTVLDIGCAYGYIVEALREKGVEAYGIDVSTYAISQASEKIKPYLKAMSALDDLPDDFPKRYDLVISIEMIEHLYEEDGLKAIDKMVAYSDKILISSTDSDFDEPTHFNVQPQEYWCEKFAKKGFIRRLIGDFSFISLNTYYFTKVDNVSVSKLVNDYERHIRILTNKYHSEQKTSGKLAADVEEVHKYWNNDKEYYQNEVNRINNELTSYRDINSQLNKDKEYYQKKINGYQLLQQQWNNDKEYYQNEVNRVNNELISYKDVNSQLNKDKEYYQEKLNDYQLLQQQWNKDVKYYKNKIKEYYDSIQILDNNNKEQQELLSAAINEKNSLLIEFNKLQILSTEQSNIIHYNEYLLETIYTSRGYRLLKKFYKIRDKLLPVNSYRRSCIKKIINAIFKKNIQTSQQTNMEVNIQNGLDEINTFNKLQYSEQELLKQEWCKTNPIDESIKFSIIVPAYKTDEKIFKEMIDSVIGQFYQNWELCIVNASPEYKYIEKICKSYKDKRIKFKNLITNGGIAENTKEALKLATGDFICLLDHDDLLAPNALSENAIRIIDRPETDFLYSDKDMVDANAENRINPLVKPEYSPELMYSANYMTHFCVIRKSVMDKVVLSKDTDGAQDWDIFLQVMEKTKNIGHIAEKLYHWRIIPSSVSSGIGAKPYALNAQLLSINNHFKRIHLPCSVDFDDEIKARIRVKWDIPQNFIIHVVILYTNHIDVKLNNIQYSITNIQKNDKQINNIIDNIECDVLVFIDADEAAEITNEVIIELASWALYPDIAFIFPAYIRGGIIKSTGLVYRGNQLYDFYPNKPFGFYGNMGSCFWYRNLSLARTVTAAIAKSKWNISKKYKKEYGSLSLAHNAIYLWQKGYRNLYNPFALVEVSWQFNDIHYLNNDFKKIKEKYLLEDKDPYLSDYAEVDITDNEEKSYTNIEQDQYTKNAFILAVNHDFSMEDIENNRQCLKNGTGAEVKSIIWFLPEFDYVFYAGLYTIFRTASYLQNHFNIENSFAFLTSKSEDEMMDKVREGFPDLIKCNAYQIQGFSDLDKLPSFDASVCTLWTTAYYSLRFNNVKRKFYFIQDYESLFYPGGSTFAQAEATYNFGFEGIVNTHGLAEVYRKDYNGRAVSLDPSVDRKNFFPAFNRQYEKNVYTVFFYGRPGHPRNGFELGVAAMRKLKEIMGDSVRIVTAGANYNLSDYGLEGVVENLGRLKIEETGNLYRNCDAGFVMMFTRHPSYLPYELMACGCCVVSNYNMYTTWLLKDGVNAVICQPSVTAIAESIANILKDKEKRKKISEYALNWIDEENPTWNESLEKVGMFITGKEQQESSNE